MGVAKALAPLAAVTAWGGFGGLILARALQVPVPSTALTTSAFLALVVALALSGRYVARFFRGPPLLAFPKDRAVLCEPHEAVVIRAAAQLRGTLGGAGHVHRARLMLPATAWAAAAVFAEGFVAPGAEASVWPVVVLVPAAVSSLLLRPRPFHYREAMGGWLVVHPPVARDWLVRGRQQGTALRGVTLAHGSDARERWEGIPTSEMDGSRRHELETKL